MSYRLNVILIGQKVKMQPLQILNPSLFENIYKIIKNNDIQDKKLVIVQIGSSSGSTIAKISNKFNNINCVGIDFIKEYVEYAKSTYPQ